MNSLRRRLLLWLLPTCMLAAVVGSAGSYWGAARQLSDLLDGQLEYLAGHVKVKNGQAHICRKHATAVGIPDDRIDAVVLQVWRGDQLEFSDDPTHSIQAPNKLGWTNVAYGDQKWRTYATRKGDRVVQIAQTEDEHLESLAKLAVHLLWPVLAFLPVLALAVWLGIGAALRPMDRVAQQLRERSADALEPITTSGRLPSELQPMMTALNDMLARVGQSFETQRRFTAEAAHELRTPVMALSVQADLAESAPSEAERVAAVRDLRAGVDRLTHLTQQLLSLARSEPNAPPVAHEPLDLTEVCRELVLEYADIAERQGVDLGMEAQGPVFVPGDRQQLGMLVRNLLDNAVRYTGRGGRVDVSAAAAGSTGLLQVRDDGPGIPPEQRERVFDRFFRGAGQTQSGSGLGLAIVKRIAQEHAAPIGIDAGPGGRGLCVRVSFRLAGPAAA